MTGTRTIRNRLSRTKGRKRPRAPAAARSGSPYRNLVITSVITILIGAVFGDLIVKKNIQNYSAEHAAFIASPEEGDAAFEEARAIYDTRLRERRRQTQRIIKYIADDSVAAFDAFYAVYDAALGDWNNHHDDMAATILNTTNCTLRFQETPRDDRLAVIGPHFDLFMNAAGFQPFLTTYSGKAELARDRFLKESRFCPTFFLTKTSGHSVHSVLSSMHRRIYNYREHDYTECRLRHKRNITTYYQSCLARESPLQQTACMREFDRKIEDGSFCDKGDFDINDYKVRDVEFNELDFYWGLGDRFFKTFRKDFILDYCTSRIGFWGSTLGWDCPASVDAYLKTH
ncbi:hypothetical protein FMN50_07800 [Rhodobacterales bacterium]|nr:hypothetical protein FMN50_07800 [Rhodobacterales bacterium]